MDNPSFRATTRVASGRDNRIGSGTPLSNTRTATTPLSSHMPSHVLSHTNLVCRYITKHVEFNTTSYPIITARCRYFCIENLVVAFSNGTYYAPYLPEPSYPPP